MPKQEALFTTSVFAENLQSICDAKSEYELADIRHNLASWNKNNKFLRWFSLAIDLQQDFLYEQKRIMQMSTAECRKLVNFYQTFDYKAYVYKLLDDRKSVLEFSQEDRDFYVDLLLYNRQRLLDLAKVLLMKVQHPELLTAYKRELDHVVDVEPPYKRFKFSES